MTISISIKPLPILNAEQIAALGLLETIAQLEAYEERACGVGLNEEETRTYRLISRHLDRGRQELGWDVCRLCRYSMAFCDCEPDPESRR